MGKPPFFFTQFSAPIFRFSLVITKAKNYEIAFNCTLTNPLKAGSLKVKGLLRQTVYEVEGLNPNVSCAYAHLHVHNWEY